MANTGFRIGGEEQEYVQLEILRRAVPDASDYWDGNWLVARITVAVGAFRGAYEANVRADELRDFSDELHRLQHELRGEAMFDTMEEQIKLHCVGDGYGHIQVQGEACDEAGVGNRLMFTLAVDQTDLQPTLRHLERALAEYPVRGAPERSG